MKLQELFLQENVTTLSSDMFPKMMSTMSEKSHLAFKTYLDILNEAVAAGEIVNPRYQDAKSFLNYRIDEAFKKLISEKYMHAGKWEQLPRDIYDTFPGYNNLQIHTLSSHDKKLAKFKNSDHPFIKDYSALVNELRPLINTMVYLKEKIVKKPKAAVEKEQQEKEHRIKIASHEDVKRIKQKLTEITTEVYNDALAANTKWLMSLADIAIAKIKDSPTTPVSDLFRRDGFLAQIAWKILIREGGRVGGKYVVKEDYKSIIEREAKQMTDDMMSHFINKNTQKLSEIIAKKNNLTDIVVLNATTSRGVVEGDMKLTFGDKAQFVVHNKVVSSTSKYGKPFYRFPTTFHNVVLSDGSKLSRPSEEAMIQNFV